MQLLCLLIDTNGQYFFIYSILLYILVHFLYIHICVADALHLTKTNISYINGRSYGQSILKFFFFSFVHDQQRSSKNRHKTYYARENYY